MATIRSAVNNLNSFQFPMCLGTLESLSGVQEGFRGFRV